MDYSKSGGQKSAKNAPKHREHNAKGSSGNPFGAKPTKTDLIARMKAAAEAKKKD
ncbi:MAG: hypothetical protein KGK00_00100 [Paracoccaceae bacterium]|nr:hypothetical protein [Paracoccaceae bacterium]